jgi:hypothetical protein
MAVSSFEVDMRQMFWLTLSLSTLLTSVAQAQTARDATASSHLERNEVAAQSDFDQCLALNNKLKQSLERQIRELRATCLEASRRDTFS